SISVLSGDVHHAYVARARFRHDPATTPVYQLTCSPVHNSVPGWIRFGFRAGWSHFAAAISRPVRRLAGVRPHSVRWSRLGGPYFGNELATLVLDDRSAWFELERARPDDVGVPHLKPVVSMELTKP
ncbi:MAG TPA: alkaline phosphatase family protein, partial [Methylomirabilota bacterium]|nr:alkaline phosphatase family protein [Methylomirabilota bacterium]